MHLMRQTALLIALLLALVAAPALAQTSITTRDAVPVVVATGPSEFQAMAAKQGGSLASAQAVQAPKNFSLIYTPKDSKQSYTDALTWTADGKPGSATVEVAVSDQAPTLATGDYYYPSFIALFTLFILAVLMESALALLFNWRPFVETFNSRGVKPLIAFVVAYVFVSQFRLDIITGLTNIYTKQSYPSSLLGVVLTAMIVAGGSSGVNNLMQTLGFRQVRDSAAPPPKPPPSTGWISVKLKRNKSIGPVDVLVTLVGTATSALGTIRGGRWTNWLADLFLKDANRYPPELGHALAPGQYTIQLAGWDDKKARIFSTQTWGPYNLPAGAIVDIELEL
jgi:hypothetical protein